MPYSRKPIEIDTTRTFNEWRIEMNAAITKLNELFDASNEFTARPGGTLESVTISGSTVNESTIMDSILNVVTINSSTWNDGVIDGATVRNSTFESTNSYNDINNPTISGGTWSNGSQSGTILNEVSLNGFDYGETTTVTVDTHSTGSSTVNLTSLSKDVTNGNFYYEDKEYTIISSDQSTNTIEVADVEADRTFSGDLKIYIGVRSTLSNPKIDYPLFSGKLHMDERNTHMLIKYGTSTKRTNEIGRGVAYELYFDTDLNKLFIFDGVTDGGIEL